jgi:hypothetical protein
MFRRYLLPLLILLLVIILSVGLWWRSGSGAVEGIADWDRRNRRLLTLLFWLAVLGLLAFFFFIFICK